MTTVTAARALPRRPSRPGALALALIFGSLTAYGQEPAAPAAYRVFLKDGQALASYGDTARVDDRVIFNLPIGGLGGQFTLRLISLPVAVVDVERTARYAEAMRAAFYAATRGEADYATMTAELARDLAELPRAEDQQRQVRLAEQARERLLAWPRQHFYYRAADISSLAALLDDVVNQLRAAAGESSFALDLSTGPAAPVLEPLLAAPGRAESIELALAAAQVADIGEDRIAILRAAAATIGDGDAGGRVRARVARRLEQELRAGRQYDALVAEFRARADAALEKGNVPAVEVLPSEVLRRDQQLGFRRPLQVQRLIEGLQVTLEATRARRVALDRYTAVRRTLLSYERRVRPALTGLDGLSSVIQSIRDRKAIAFQQTVSAERRLLRLQEQVEGVTPPAELAAVHTTLVSALRMAREACVRRQRADVTTTMQATGEASAAAAGALLLAARARADLVAGLYPPPVN